MMFVSGFSHALQAFEYTWKMVQYVTSMIKFVV